MTGPRVTTDADLLDLAARWTQSCGACDGGLPMDCTHPNGDPRIIMTALVAALDQRTRVAASLKADLARIIGAWDAGRANRGSPFAPEYPAELRDAITAAREWVGAEVVSGE